MKKLKITCYAFFLLMLVADSASSQTGYNEEIRKYAASFVNTLEPMQRRAALLAKDDTARIKWNNLPVGMRARAGISIGNMTEPQRKILHRMLSVSLSSQGYLKATSILHLDNLLNQYYDSLYFKKEIDDAVYQRIHALQWSHRNFYLAFFGQPTEKVWGFKLEGHHLSINFSFVEDKISVTPFFIGTDPSEYPLGEYAGWRVLGQEEDLGIHLMQMLTTAQQAKALISNNVPKDIFTAAESGIRLLDYQGVKASEMTKDQKAAMLYIIREYVFNMEYEKATMEYEKILKAGVDNIYFGWIGAVDEFKAHYYVLNGPGFLIEFDNSGGNGKGNHIHSIWREKGNEYGEDVLKKHYQSEKH